MLLVSRSQPALNKPSAEMSRSSLSEYGTRTIFAIHSPSNCHDPYRDTVASVGMLMSKTLPFTTANTTIKTFRHALSLDEVNTDTTLCQFVLEN